MGPLHTSYETWSPRHRSPFCLSGKSPLTGSIKTCTCQGLPPPSTSQTVLSIQRSQRGLSGPPTSLRSLDSAPAREAYSQLCAAGTLSFSVSETGKRKVGTLVRGWFCWAFYLWSPSNQLHNGNCQMYQRLGNTTEETGLDKEEIPYASCCVKIYNLSFSLQEAGGEFSHQFALSCPHTQPGRLRSSSRNSLQSSTKNPFMHPRTSPFLPASPAQPSTQSHR